MLAVSDRWEPTVQTSHDVVTRVEVWRGGEELVHDLPIVSGKVTRDYGSTNTLDCEITVGDPAFLPSDFNAPLAPFGSELRVWTGIRYPDQLVEMYQIFSGPIVGTPTWPSREEFVVNADGWLRFVADDRFLAPYSPAAGVQINSEITRLLQESVPGASVTFGPGVPVKTASEGLLWEEDRLQAVLDLADSLGAVLRENPTGGFSIEKDALPDPDAVPVRQFIHGRFNVLLARTDPGYSREERYNGCVAYNADDPTIRALATIDDPTAPTRWGGPFGKKVLYYSSPLLTAATVQQAAQTRLDGLFGRSRKVDAQILPDPSIEPGDHVRIEWPPVYGSTASVGLSEVAQVRKVTNPLGPGATELELRGAGL